MQIPKLEQDSPSVQGVLGRQVEGDWQVSGPPLVNSVQDVSPVMVEQSDMTAQMTKYWKITVYYSV